MGNLDRAAVTSTSRPIGLKASKSARGGPGHGRQHQTRDQPRTQKEHNVTIHQRRGRHHAGYRLASLLRKRQPRRARRRDGAFVPPF